MIWLKKAYQDKSTRWLTFFILVGGPIWSGLSYLINPVSDTWWQAWVFFWGFYVVIFFPALYFLRSAK